MTYSINLTPAAVADIQDGFSYYNSKVKNLGFRFADEVDAALHQILLMPTAYSYRYKEIRGKKINKFPYVVYFIMNNNSSIIEVLRIFNAYQRPNYQDDY